MNLNKKLIEEWKRNKRTKLNYVHRQKYKTQNNLLIEWFDSLDHRGENMTKQLSIRRVFFYVFELNTFNINSKWNAKYFKHSL